jgi:hypothetical protein
MRKGVKVRRGCIAVGKVECDGCGRLLKYGEHYLMIDGEEDEKRRFCIDCCVSRGHSTYRTNKGKQIVTFLPEE